MKTCLKLNAHPSFFPHGDKKMRTCISQELYLPLIHKQVLLKAQENK